MYSYAHIEIVILLFIALAVCLRILAMRRSYAEKLTWMLYRDASSGLHNRIWLEHEINHRLERMDKQKEDTSDAAIVVFQIRQVDVLASTYGQDIINEMMKRLGSSLQREKWIQAVGVRSGSGQVIVFTRPMSVIQLRLAVQTAMLGLEYMDVGDMNLRAHATDCGHQHLQGRAASRCEAGHPAGYAGDAGIGRHTVLR